MTDIRVPGSDDLRSLVDLIDSADRLRVLISGTEKTPGLLSKTDEIAAQLSCFVSSTDDVFMRLNAAASLSSEVRDLPNRLLTAAESKPFKDCLESSMAAAAATSIEAARASAWEIATDMATFDIQERLEKTLEAASRRMFGSDSLADQFAVRKKAERETKDLVAELEAANSQIKALKSAETARIGELAASEKARRVAISALEEERYLMATKYLATAQRAAVSAALRRFPVAVVLGIFIGVWASNQFVGPAVYEFLFKASAPCAPGLG